MPSHADRVRRHYDSDDPESPRAETDPSKSPIDENADADDVHSEDAPDGTTSEHVRVECRRLNQYYRRTRRGRRHLWFIRDLGVDGIVTDFPDVAFRVWRAPLATGTRQ